MKKTVPRKKDLIVDQEKKRLQEQLDADKRSKERTDQIKNFFGFGKSPEEPEVKSSRPAPRPNNQKASEIHKASKFKIFEDSGGQIDPRVVKQDYKFRPKTKVVSFKAENQGNFYTKRERNFDPFRTTPEQKTLAAQQKYPTFGQNIQKKKIEKQREGMFDRIKNFFRGDQPKEEEQAKEGEIRGANIEESYDGELSVPPVQYRPHTHKYVFFTPNKVPFLYHFV